jgi:Domain of unknown function (DUF1707)
MSTDTAGSDTAGSGTAGSGTAGRDAAGRAAAARAAAGAGRIRASDAEREEYARVVRESVGEGRLTLGEGDERLAGIYASSFRDELGPFVADLPRADLPRADTGERSGYGYRGHRGQLSQTPSGQPVSPRLFHAFAFLRHLSFVAMIAAVLLTIWALSSAHVFWPAIPLIFLGFGLFRHGMFWWFGSRRGWGRYGRW